MRAPIAITVGLVGAGSIARQIHLPVLASIIGVSVVAIVDPDRQAGTAAASRAGSARWFADLDALLDGAQVDALVVCAPSAEHAGIAKRAFAAGKAVYLEKPIALTLSDGRAVTEARRAAGAIGMTGFMLRFAPAFVHARARIAAGVIGEVVAAHSVFVSPPGERPAWRGRRATGGGALVDLVSHHVDLTRWLLTTEIGSVAAQLRSVRGEDDTAAVTMLTTSGVTVQTLACTSAAEDHRFEIVGTEGRLVVDPWRMATPEQFGIQGAGGLGPRLAPLAPRRLFHRPGYRATFRAALATFASSVGTGQHPTPDLADGLISLAVIEAAERAAHAGAVESVPVVVPPALAAP